MINLQKAGIVVSLYSGLKNIFIIIGKMDVWLFVLRWVNLLVLGPLMHPAVIASHPGIPPERKHNNNSQNDHNSDQEKDQDSKHHTKCQNFG